MIGTGICQGHLARASSTSIEGPAYANAVVRDLRLRHKNYDSGFSGAAYRASDAAIDRDAEALRAVQEFSGLFGRAPNEYSWTAAGMRPD
jgi:hypothetical protein